MSQGFDSNTLKQKQTRETTDGYKDLYNKYIQSDDKSEEISLSLFVLIIKLFFKLIVFDVIENNRVIKIPFNLGYFYKRKVIRNLIFDENNKLDVKKSTLIKKKGYYNYDDLKNNRFKYYDLNRTEMTIFSWKKGKVKNISYMYIKLSDSIKKDLATKIKTDG